LERICISYLHPHLRLRRNRSFDSGLGHYQSKAFFIILFVVLLAFELPPSGSNWKKLGILG
jgi:hypothetical protein